MTEQSQILTRQGLHAVAELLLAGPQHREHGTIRLRAVPGGFGTVSGPDVQVVGAELVRSTGAGLLRLSLDGARIDELAAQAGLEPGAPVGVYPDSTGASLDHRLQVDSRHAERLADWFEVGDRALRRLDPQAVPVIWPEHFDLAISLGEVNYGVSPGDGYSAEPYAYVGPFTQRPGAFWNAPFGATRSIGEVGTADAVVDFFEQGRQAATR